MLFLPLTLFLSSLLSACHAKPSFRTHHKRQQAFADTEAGGIVVNNNLGQAHGVLEANNQVARFVVQYATAPRFGQPVEASSWTGLSDPSAMPPVCPQVGFNDTQYSENCLYAVIYVPVTALATPRTTTIPTFVWLHGGSFVIGSASMDGLDGSNLALATNSIIVVPQYRLGVLGWLPPSAGPSPNGNLGVQDAIMALKFVNNVISFFGGSTPVTIGGQSSGGHLVRALMAAPAASSYFHGATMHADPVDYGFMKVNVWQTLQSSFYSMITNCTSYNVQCLQQLSIDTLMTYQYNFVNTGYASSLDVSVGTGEPIRPHFDGGVITNTLTTNYPGQKKPILMTSNKNDAGQVVGENFPADIPESYWSEEVEIFVGSNRISAIESSHYYNPTDPQLTPPYPTTNASDITRQVLERDGTDQVWRCANWDFARRWTQNGGVIYVATLQVGSTYAGNQLIDYCVEPGVVCHEDEIYIIFGNMPSPTPAQTAVSQQIQARLKAFFLNPNAAPNPTGYSTWVAAGTSNVNAVQLGGSSDGQPVPVGACNPSFWGSSSVPFEWQMFGE